MGIEHWEYQSEPFKKAKAEGAAEGEARARREDLMGVLEVRGLAVSDEQRARIEETDDEDTLRRWHLRAVTAVTVEEVLGD